MYSNDGGSRSRETRPGYDNAGARLNCRHMQRTVASMFVTLKQQGTVRCLNGALKGPRLSQNETFNGHRAAWFAKL